MANGRRCDIGCESWPDKPLFSKCPICGLPTECFDNLEPLDMDEALRIKARAEFDLYYARRCEKLGIPVEGPLPREYEQALPAPRSLVG